MIVTSQFEIKVKGVFAKIFPVRYEGYIRSERWPRKAEVAKARVLGNGKGVVVLTQLLRYRLTTGLMLSSVLKSKKI